MRARRRRPRRLDAWRGYSLRKKILVCLFFWQIIALGWTAAPAFAAGTGAQGDDVGLFGVTDTTKTPCDDYFFSFNRGKLFDIDNKAAALAIQFEYAPVKAIDCTALRIVRFGNNSEWRNWITPVMTRLDATSHALAAKMAVGGGALALSVLIMFFRSLRGDSARAKADFAGGLLIAIFGAVFLANPLQTIIGPHGLLAESDDLATWISSTATKNDPATLEQHLATAVLRKPTARANFKADPDAVSPACGAAYTKGIQSGDRDEPRKAVSNKANCGDKAAIMAKYADNPTGDVAGDITIMGIFAAGLLFFILRVVWIEIKGPVSAMIHAIILNPIMPVAVVPGPPRQWFWRALRGVGVGLAVFIGAKVLLNVGWMSFETAYGSQRDPMWGLFCALFMILILLSSARELQAFAKGQPSPMLSSVASTATAPWRGGKRVVGAARKGKRMAEKYAAKAATKAATGGAV